MTEREQLLVDLMDLRKQATTERSHYYVASVVERCIGMLGIDAVVIGVLQEKIDNLEDRVAEALSRDE
jgi:hypothetical protein